MTLAADEYIRRFLLHILPTGFHRIRHYGLLADSSCQTTLDHVRRLLGVAPALADGAEIEPPDLRPPCPCCGGHMVIVETFERRRQPGAPPALGSPSGA